MEDFQVEDFFNSLSNSEKYDLVIEAGLNDFDRDTDFDYSNLIRKEKLKISKLIKKMKRYDVLIWENPPEDNDIPFMLDEVSKEFTDLSLKEALKEYYSNDFTHKQLIEYQSSDPDSDGDIIEEDTNEEYEDLL
tara:strand:+ start:13 stop:414 length:402 start_codon:yes stop_codon:yes gene_type:complete